LQPELSTVFHAEGSGSVEPTSGGYNESFSFSLDVPTVTLPAGAVVQSDMLSVGHSLVANTSEDIQTVPINPALPYKPFIFSLELHWAVLCQYGPGGICAVDQGGGVQLVPPYPERLEGAFDILFTSNTVGTGAYGGVNAISDDHVTTDYALSVSALRSVEYSLPVPEPASAVVTGLSLLCLGVLRKRRTLQ